MDFCPTSMPDQDFHCPTCGRDYDDAADHEIELWLARGWCCDYCYIDCVLDQPEPTTEG